MPTPISSQSRMAYSPKIRLSSLTERSERHGAFEKVIRPEGVMVPVPQRYELFDHIREVAGLRLGDVVGSLLPRIANELISQPAAATSLPAEAALSNAAQVLLEEVDIRSESAAGTLDEFHFHSLQDPVPAGKSVRASGSPATSPLAPFELVSDAALTDQILAQTLAGRAREALEEAYPAYLSRVAQLTGTPADEDNCPLGAKALATALVTAVRPFSSNPMTRDRIEAAMLKHAVIPIREIIAAADRKMADQGILSMLPRIVVFPGLRKAVEGAVTRSARGSAAIQVQPSARAVDAVEPADRAVVQDPQAADMSPALPASPAAEVSAAADAVGTADVTGTVDVTGTDDVVDAAGARQASAEAGGSDLDGGREEPTRAGFSGMVAVAARKVVRDAKASMVLGAHPMVGTRDPRSAFRQAEMLPGTDSLERDAIAFAHQVGHPPFSTPARQEFFNQLRHQMKAAGVDAAHLATLDLVAAMFDYAADHERIPDPARPLMWRLQLPSVALACLDPGYLSDEPRSVRRLVEHVAAIATAYPDDIARGSELHARLQTVVRAVEVVAHAFQVRSQVLSEQVRIEYQRATYGMSQLVSKVTRERRELEANNGRRNRRDYRRRPSREREFEISGRIEKLLTERLQDRQVPETVAEFLKGVWLRHLRTAVLRDGEESAGYQAALKVVDDLLWTIDGEGQRRSRSELAQRIPLMLKILTQGISDIGARAEDYRPFFDEMFLIHLRRMQKRRKPATTDAAGGREDLPILSDRVAASPPATSMTPMAPAPFAAGSQAAPVRRSTFAAAKAAAAAAVPAVRPDAAKPEGSPGRLAKAPPDKPVEAAPDEEEVPVLEPAPPADAAAATGTRKRRPAPEESDGQSASELKLRRLIDDTSLADAPRRPLRMEIAPAELARELAPGQWLELITSKGTKILAKVAWINERRSVVLLLQHPDRLILSRHVAALKERAERKRVFRVS
jgi:hypothetical protein